VLVNTSNMRAFYAKNRQKAPKKRLQAQLSLKLSWNASKFA